MLDEPAILIELAMSLSDRFMPVLLRDRHKAQIGYNRQRFR
jgi:hypothetical protein